MQINFGNDSSDHAWQKILRTIDFTIWKARRRKPLSEETRLKQRRAIHRRLLRHRTWMITRDGAKGLLLMLSILFWSYIALVHENISFADLSGSLSMIVASILPFVVYGRKFRKATYLLLQELLWK